ncbi:MAG TPA: glycosyltransferase family 39 protein [Verrucomicrobiae bacterium]|jgi:4-amino-4-deoxy-L-arabinose transferase-like glycosyltransferase
MNSRRKIWTALSLLLIVAFVASVRLRLRSIPLERDEGEYAYAGQLILQGVPPYQLVYNMKMPGIYAAYALLMAVFGQTTEGIREGFILVNCGAIVLMYFVGRRFLPTAGAVAASAAYALMSLAPGVQGFNAHATHFVVVAALGAILLLLRAQERGRLAGYFWSGTLFGAAFLMKQPGGAFAFFGASVIAWAAWRRTTHDWRADGRRLALYAAGVAAPIVLTCLVMWLAGVWDKFWWWTVTYARTHATALAWKYGKLRLADFFKQLSGESVFWWLALAGLIPALAVKGRADEKFFFLSLLFFSIAAVCPTLNFTAHYFVLMLPIIALLAARLFIPAAEWVASRAPGPARCAPWIAFGLACGWMIWFYFGAFFLWTPENVADRLYHVNNFQVYPEVADYIKSHSAPGATLAVLGSEPEVPFLARRRSVTGYIYMYDLVQDQPFRERMEKEMIGEVEHGQPDYIVFVSMTTSWLPFPKKYFDEILDWLERYTDRDYVPCGVVTFQPNQYFWGADCLRSVPIGHRFVTIFQRKPGLPKSGT